MKTKTKKNNSPLKVLFATSEITPWIKTGGLADVSGALPPALAAAGCDVRILVPAYPAIKGAFPRQLRRIPVPQLAPRLPACSIIETEPVAEGVYFWLIDAPGLFDRPGNPYNDSFGHDWADNVWRFGLLSRVAAWLAESASQTGWQPDILHCNDWHTALAPAYLRYLGGRTRSVLTVHNMAFHGLYPATCLEDLALPPHAFSFDGVEFHGKLSFLKAGLQAATRITTVSPTYAREVQTKAFGCGLEGLLRYRADVLDGILNGIDLSQWNPASDPLIPNDYSRDSLERKAQNTTALKKRLGLVPGDAPLLGIVSRMTHQKGFSLILEIADQLIATGCQFVILGSGEKRMERDFSELAHRHPRQAMVVIGYEEGLAHQIEAGADIFLMPSLFEPCGLNQMYSLRYGTPPVVRRTGGLADTVVDTTPETLADGTANGFVFDDPDPQALFATVMRAVATKRDAATWTRVQQNGMALEMGWDQAAQHYLDVYRAALAA